MGIEPNSNLKKQLFNPNTRIGSYGLITKDQKVLLIDKSKGPYQKQLDLPGGKIEFSESPKEAFIRECVEEVALKPIQVRLMDVYSHFGTYRSQEGPLDFHQLGIVYIVDNYQKLENKESEEKSIWVSMDQLDMNALTPIACKALQFFLDLSQDQLNAEKNS